MGHFSVKCWKDKSKRITASIPGKARTFSSEVVTVPPTPPCADETDGMTSKRNDNMISRLIMTAPNKIAQLSGCAFFLVAAKV